MEQKPPLIPAAPLFPKKPYKISTVILFSAFARFASIAVWISFRELIVPHIIRGRPFGVGFEC